MSRYVDDAAFETAKGLEDARCDRVALLERARVLGRMNRIRVEIKTKGHENVT